MSDTPPPTPPRPAVPAPAPDAAIDAAGVAPKVALGDGVTPMAFAPGRYASHIQVSAAGNHAVNRVRESSTAIFVLDLAADGTATACRGWTYAMSNDGPDVHTKDHQEVQQGYRGTYAVVDGVARIELTPDAAAPCPAHNAYREFKAEPIALRAVLATPHAGGELAGVAGPVLFCEWLPPVPRTNPGAHRTPGLAPDGWSVLGSGRGLRAKVTGVPGTPANDKPSPSQFRGEPTRVVAASAPGDIAVDDWKRPF